MKRYNNDAQELSTNEIYVSDLISFLRLREKPENLNLRVKDVLNDMIGNKSRDVRPLVGEGKPVSGATKSTRDIRDDSGAGSSEAQSAHNAVRDDGTAESLATYIRQSISEISDVSDYDDDDE